MHNKKIKLIASLSLILSCLIFLNSCKKTDLKPSDPKKLADHVIHYSPANIKVNAGFIDKDGNEVPFSRFSSQSQRMMDDFPGCGDRSYLINLIYNGFVAEQYYGGDWTLTYT